MAMSTKSDKARVIRLLKRTHGAAYARIGGLSCPSKMPGFSIGLPAEMCQTGSKLRKVEGSVCSDCYGCKGNYRFRTVQSVQYLRLAALSHPSWVDDMVEVIDFACDQLKEFYFRFHDTGDVQSLKHLMNIVEIARRLPKVRFWLPTHEYQYQRALAAMKIPANLVIRFSAPMVDQHYSTQDFVVSTVSSRRTWVQRTPIAVPGSVICAAPFQGGSCEYCRACWSPHVQSVSYAQH